MNSYLTRYLDLNHGNVLAAKQKNINLTINYILESQPLSLWASVAMTFEVESFPLDKKKTYNPLINDFIYMHFDIKSVEIKLLKTEKLIIISSMQAYLRRCSNDRRWPANAVLLVE